MIQETSHDVVEVLHKRFYLFKDKNFLSLMFGTWFSTIGDGAYFIILGWYVLNITGSEVALGTTLTAASIPRIIFMLVGGALADRIDRKRILMMSLFIRAVLLILFAFLIVGVHRKPELWLIDLIAVSFGIIDAFFYPASSSIVPSAVPTQVFEKANSLIQTVQQLSTVLGPLLAAGLLLFLDYQMMFVGISIIYLLSTTLLSFLKLRRYVDHVSSLENQIIESPSSMWSEIREGTLFVWSSRILATLMLISLMINLLFMGPINIGIPILIKSFGWSGGTYGLYESGFGLGAVSGGLIVVILKGFRGKFIWLAGLGAFMGSAMAGIGFVYAPWGGILLMILMGIAITIVNIPLINYIQTIVPANKLGRTMSVLTLMSMGLVPVSYTVSSFIIEAKWINVRELLLGSGILITLLFCSLYLIRDFRNMEEHPVWKNKYLQNDVESS